MAVKNDGLCMTYTINRLSETAKTFRRLGEAYECASGDEAQVPALKDSCFLLQIFLRTARLCSYRQISRLRELQEIWLQGHLSQE
ncbi:MAG: hypothetical protein ACLT33_10085 [Lachnospira pectinoschiza]